MKKVRSVEEYITSGGEWKESLGLLRELCASTILEETIQNQKDGKEIKPDSNKPIVIPVELENAFSQNPALKGSFDALTLSKKREFAEHIGSAKREETRHKVSSESSQ